MTRKLYEDDGLLREFDAAVVRCEKQGDLWEAVLDQTAFFPEGGGQAADTGTLGGARVTDVQIKNGEIIHTLDAPLAAKSRVHGALDWPQRFSRMQHHTGEHILSGTLHRLYQLDNVGFHMGSQDVTLDVNGALTREELLAAEREANLAIARNVSVRAYYPDAQALDALEYRSKKQIDGAVRIVEIDGIDRCACCAPHLPQTGGVGLVKILDAVHYKGGMRLHILCGLSAVRDYEEKYEAVAAIASSLSVKQEQAEAAVAHLSDELAQKNGELRRAMAAMAQLLAQNVAPREGALCLFAPFDDRDALRIYALEAAKRCGGVCVVFGENSPRAYAAAGPDVRTFVRDMNAALSGRGGGTDALCQGSCTAEQDAIEAFFSEK